MVQLIALQYYGSNKYSGSRKQLDQRNGKESIARIIKYTDNYTIFLLHHLQATDCWTVGGFIQENNTICLSILILLAKHLGFATTTDRILGFDPVDAFCFHVITFF